MDKTRPLISIIIPTYNRAKYVTRAIESVLAQTYKNFEIIVVDDGSTDNTREVISQYDSSLVKYHYQENKGVSAARNRGIELAQGEWIGFLDSDDEWMPEQLQVHVNALEKNRNVVLHTTNALIYGLSTKTVNMFNFMKFPIHNTVVKRPLILQLKYGFVRIQCAIIKKSILSNMEWFNCNFNIYEDLDFFCRIALKGPWAISNNTSVKIYRNSKDADEEHLSDIRINDPRKSNIALVRIYNNLYFLDITKKERIIIKKKLGSVYRALGNVYKNTPNKRLAKHYYRLALKNDFSYKSLIKFLLAH